MTRCRSIATAAALIAGMTAATTARAGNDVQATPADYATKLAALQPGDTLHLAAGTYEKQLNVANLNGSASAWITIEGPDADPPAVFPADPAPCCNTVEISNSSFVKIAHLTIDGMHVDGAFGVSAKSGVVHDITIEGCHFVNHDGSQQDDAISTKITTWNWIIRDNKIEKSGTGLYLGNSTGDAPFVAGLIEGNTLVDSIGYLGEIKFYPTRPSIPGVPDGASTIIRHNVFIKTDTMPQDGARPNFLVGGFPASGPGAGDRYEIYGNVFAHNPYESLFQASGRVTVHDNIFVDSMFNALSLQDQDLPLEQAFIYDNTIYSTQDGVHFANTAPGGDAVFGNLIFSPTPITGPIGDQHDNLVDTVANAGMYVNAPGLDPATFDFYPKTGQCQGTPMDATKAMNDVDYAVDFNGASRGMFTFRGAYAGDGMNPTGGAGGGSSSASSAATGAVGAGGATTSTSSSATSVSSNSSGGGAADDPGETSGCGCRLAGSSDNHHWDGVLAALAAISILSTPFRRRGRRAAASRPCRVRSRPRRAR